MIELTKDIIYLLVKLLALNDIINFSLINKHYHNVIGEYLRKKFFYRISDNGCHQSYDDLKKISERKCKNVLISGISVKEEEIIFDNESYDFAHVQKIHIADFFKKTIHLYNLINLNELVFGMYFDRPIYLIGLKNLSVLKLGCDFNQPLCLCGLKNLKRLVLSHSYNHPLMGIRKLKKLEELYIGWMFDRSLDLRKCKSMKNVYISRSFQEDLIKKDEHVQINLK